MLSGDQTYAKRGLDKCKSMGIQLNAIALSSTVQSAAKLSGIDLVDCLFARMEVAHVDATIEIIGAANKRKHVMTWATSVQGLASGADFVYATLPVICARTDMHNSNKKFSL